MTDFNSLFSSKKPIIGMIHLSPSSSKATKIDRAISELLVYQEEGLDGAIVENYHGSRQDVIDTLLRISLEKWTITIGVNMLYSPHDSLKLATEFGAPFVQLDTVEPAHFDLNGYLRSRASYPEVAVLGGVGFKGTTIEGNPEGVGLIEATQRCEAIVTTGPGTGVETPLEKLVTYKKILGDFPLITGAGVTADNVAEQLSVADGAIVGSYFKPDGNTYHEVDRNLVRGFMNAARE